MNEITFTTDSGTDVSITAERGRLLVKVEDVEESVVVVRRKTLSMLLSLAYIECWEREDDSIEPFREAIRDAEMVLDGEVTLEENMSVNNE